MNRQFIWNSAGVAAWQEDIYHNGQSAVEQECTWILSDFVAWISYRFSFDDAQTAFLISLGSLAQESYATSIANTLQHWGSISLDKETAARQDHPTIKNPKIIIREEELQRRSEETLQANTGVDPAYTIALRFHIYYLDNPSG